MGVDTNSWDCIVIYIIVKRLTSETHQLWEESQRGCQDLPTFEQLSEFLESRYRTLEIISNDRRSVNKEASTNSGRNSKRQSYHTSTSGTAPSSYTCVMCKGDHNIRTCEKFKAATTTARFEIAKKYNLCTNCLRNTHSSARCPSTKRCLQCNKRHHTLLHSSSATSTASKPTATTSSAAKPSAPTTSASNPNTLASSTSKPIASTSHTAASPQTSNKEDGSLNINTFHASNAVHHNILLATAIIRITSNSGIETTVRALLDPASEGSFITENVAR